METDKIDIKTVQAIDTLLELFTEAQKEILALKSNGIVVNLAQQFLSRWWNYVPVAPSKWIFQAHALKILDANKGWIDFIQEVSTRNLFQQLLKPENYKQINTKNTDFKGTAKRYDDRDTNSVDLTRVIGRTVSGSGGINRAYAYTSEWDKADRKRLDAMKFERVMAPELQETDEQDDSMDIKDWLDKQERLDVLQAATKVKKTPVVKFDDNNSEVYEKEVRLFDTAVQQNTGATTLDKSANITGYSDELRRQSYKTTNESIILADAINNIHNIDFMDVREKLFQKFDTLFIYRSRTCR